MYDTRVNLYLSTAPYPVVEFDSKTCEIFSAISTHTALTRQVPVYLCQFSACIKTMKSCNAFLARVHLICQLLNLVLLFVEIYLLFL